VSGEAARRPVVPARQPLPDGAQQEP
jgi:hypothetical protein